MSAVMPLSLLLVASILAVGGWLYMRTLPVEPRHRRRRR
jgi:hypothetical protein